MSGNSPRVIENNDQLFHNYHSLNENSIVCCRLRMIPGEEHILTDLLDRRVTLIPSATSQLASRSKTFQTRILSHFMLPNTIVIYDGNGLLEATSHFNKQNIGEVIVKRDRKNGGIGIHRFNNIEDAYNLLSLNNQHYPVVLQPFLKDFIDIRVVNLGEYVEAYERINPMNFRHNLHCGGSAKSVEPDEELLNFCNNVMRCGKFPYAHIDVMRTEEGKIYLSEINLRGGLRGAKIKAGEYGERVDTINKQLLKEVLKQ